MKNQEQKKMIARMTKTVEVTHIKCDLGVRWWDDSTLDGKYDDKDNPKMPCVYTDKDGDKRWLLEIDPKTGIIENWDKGHTADIHYKVCEDCDITYSFEDGSTYDYGGYIPGYLCPEEDGYGDYVIMSIDEDGHIRNWGVLESLDIDLTKDSWGD